MWRGLRHLLPGHLLTAGPDGGVKIKEYAAIGPAERVDLSRKDAAARLRELLDRSVAAHMTSDVPVGAFPQRRAGLVGALRRRYPSRPGTSDDLGGRLRRYPARWTKVPEAWTVARHLDADHHEMVCYAEDLPATLTALTRAHDEPFGDAADIPLYLLSRQLRDHGVKVVLQGDGGDEILGGYRHYRLMSLLPWLRRAAALTPPFCAPALGVALRKPGLSPHVPGFAAAGTQ